MNRPKEIDILCTSSIYIQNLNHLVPILNVNSKNDTREQKNTTLIFYVRAYENCVTRISIAASA